MGVAPDRPYPDSAYGKRGTMRGFQDIDEAEAKRRMRKPIDDANNTAHGRLFGGLFNGFPNLLAGIGGTVNNSYIAQMPIISNHEARLTATEEAVRQSILQGEAVTFSASGWWKPPRDLIYAELIGVAGGGGGAAGTWNVIATAQRGGDGGGGGGLKNLDGITRLYAKFLPKTGDDYDWIYVSVYAAGPGGVGSGSPGGAGGNIIFGSNLATPLVTFEGGWGAATGDTVPSTSGQGGSGMVPGGHGGFGAQTPRSGAGGTNGESSISPYSFLGGGPGGAGGGCANFSSAGTGGSGVATTGGGPGQPGISPHPAIAAGGSGGGGARNTGEPGGAGGFPGGGGGGGYGGSTSASNGGKGGEPKLFVLETRMAVAA
ncbi:glycine-rich domain-containing protein [Rhodococcus baikonurensis]|uniref:Glycine-rich domain-containing protein n=1 Tax=Rhodococcus baikonurensis TaxID=172041 RepID=A0ABV5X8P3_9NOCA